MDELMSSFRTYDRKNPKYVKIGFAETPTWFGFSTGKNYEKVSGTPSDSYSDNMYGYDKYDYDKHVDTFGFDSNNEFLLKNSILERDEAAQTAAGQKIVSDEANAKYSGSLNQWEASKIDMLDKESQLLNSSDIFKFSSKKYNHS